MITVSNVSYNPVDRSVRDGFIAQTFYQTFQQKMSQDSTFKPYLGQLGNVIKAIQDQNFKRGDIDKLTTDIRTALQKAFQTKGLVLANQTQVSKLEQLICAELVANIQIDPTVNMNKQEAAAFDQLIGFATLKSRRKRNPSQIAYASLPTPLRGAVDRILQGIRDINADNRWTAANLPREYTFPVAVNPLGPDIFSDLTGYQGNHSNESHWLPKANAPENQLLTIANRIQQSPGISPGLQALLVGTNTQTIQASLANTVALGNEYDQLRQPLLQACGNANILLSVWSAVAQEVSAYIEFSLSNDISRLMYDFVNRRVYICAHYKWRNGYNPFFEVLQFPAV